jgi:hypothetical protein
MLLQNICPSVLRCFATDRVQGEEEEEEEEEEGIMYRIRLSVVILQYLFFSFPKSRTFYLLLCCLKT